MESSDTQSNAILKALDMNAAAWNLLAERSRALVHHASLLMGVLTHPTLADDADSRALVAGQVEDAVQALIAALSTTPELSAHLRTIQRFEMALSAWQRCVDECSPLTRRYQTALLQQAAQVLTSCLHVEGLSASESARVEVSRQDVARAAEVRTDTRDEPH
jgi:hypothetical protein